MLKDHVLRLPDIVELSYDQSTPAPRLALAGGSNRRPPDDRSRPAVIIPFPRERVRPQGSTNHGSEKAPDKGPEATPDESAASASPQWPAWMAHVLTRYRTPQDGGQGPTGVFI